MQISGKTVAVIGGGNMGQAIVGGLIKSGVSASRVIVVEAKAPQAAAVSRRFGIRRATLEDAARRGDAIVIAVKPQDVVPVLDGLRAAWSTRRTAPLVISIAAGLTIAALARRLGNTPVVRVMPNLPAKVGCAMSAVAAGKRVTRSQRALAVAIFRSIGDIVELPERLFDVVTAISGSGPAYFFLILQALRDAGVRRGLPKPVAERLAVQTALGSVAVFRSAGEELEALIAQVASKRGTTEAALKVFRVRGLARLIDAAVGAAARRSKELSWLLSKS